MKEKTLATETLFTHLQSLTKNNFFCYFANSTVKGTRGSDPCQGLREKAQKRKIQKKQMRTTGKKALNS